jgi:Vacuolar import and degradation protein
VDPERGLIGGIIDKKVISINGKKLSMRVFFEGEIIDGINHTFTSSLTANCEALDVYFWSRFPSFKDIHSLRNLQEHSSNYIYMRWTEKGTVKTSKRVKKADKHYSESESEEIGVSSKLKEELRNEDEWDDDQEFEFIEYFENNMIE